MLDKDSKVAIVLPDRKLLDMAQGACVKSKLNKIVQFQSVDEAYEVLSRQQVNLVLVGTRMPDNPGVTLMQRLCATGNYGLEPFVFLAEKVDQPTMQIFFEFDVDYVLKLPVESKVLDQKIAQVIERENNIPEEVKQYRDAKGAFHTGILDMAEEFAKSLVEVETIGEKAKLLLGDIALKNEDFAKAENFYQTVLSKNKDSVAATHRMAKLLIATKKFEKAKQYLDKIVDLNPNHLGVLEKSGTTNLELGHVELAKKQMAKLENLDKTNKVASEVTTTIAIKEGNFDGISERLARSHSEQELVSLLNMAGVKLSKNEDFDGAIKIYKDCLKVVKKKEYKGKIAYNLAIAYRKLGDEKNAISWCQNALQALPNLDKAKQMLSQLQSKPAA